MKDSRSRERLLKSGRKCEKHYIGGYKFPPGSFYIISLKRLVQISSMDKSPNRRYYNRFFWYPLESSLLNHSMAWQARSKGRDGESGMDRGRDRRSGVAVDVEVEVEVGVEV